MKNCDTQTHVKRIGPEIQEDKLVIVIVLFQSLSYRQAQTRWQGKRGGKTLTFSHFFSSCFFLFSIYFFIVLNCTLDYFLNAREKLTVKPIQHGRRGGPVVCALVSRSSALRLSPGQGHCVVFLGKTLNSHSASLLPGV